MIPVHSFFTVGPSSKPAAGDEPPYDRHYTVMRICVSEADVTKVMSEQLWPDGVTVRRWVFKDKAKEMPSSWHTLMICLKRLLCCVSLCVMSHCHGYS